MPRTVIILTPLSPTASVFQVISTLSDVQEVAFVQTASQLKSRTAQSSFDVLISYGTGVIVPVEVLARFGGRAYNFHAASPDYPGRDSHHFAVYDGVSRYGATAHIMTERVDEGEIVGVSVFDAPPGVEPDELREMANDSMERLFRDIAPRMIMSDDPLPSIGVHWSGRKRSRKEFRDLCKLHPGMQEAEFKRRIKAVKAKGHRNAVLEMYGITFRIDEDI